MHSTYMAYIFNDRNSTFWHALVPGLRAYTVPSSILTALLSEKRQSTGMGMEGSLSKADCLWFLLQSGKVCPGWGGAWCLWALVGSLKQQMSSTQVSITLGTESLPHEPPSEQTTADQKDCLFSEVITTGSGKENRERSHPSHLSAYNQNLGGSWHGPAEGNEVGCSCVGHQRNQEGSCAARGKKRWKWSFFTAQFGLEGSFWGFLQRLTPCVLPLLLPLKKKQTLAKMLQDACCHLCIWDKPRHKASVSPSNSVREATQHFAEVQQFSCILLLSLPPYKTVSTSFMVGLTPVLMSFKILQDSACFNL